MGFEGRLQAWSVKGACLLRRDAGSVFLGKAADLREGGEPHSRIDEAPGGTGRLMHGEANAGHRRRYSPAWGFQKARLLKPHRQIARLEVLVAKDDPGSFSCYITVLMNV